MFASSRAFAAAGFCAMLVIAAAAAGHGATVDDTRIAWAYGTIVDSITVTGNRGTRDYVLLREMETQVGEVLDPDLIRRDLRLIGDLSPIAEVTARADSLSPGHSALRIDVRERSALFLKSILPFLKYDFETGLEYGVRWRDKNFRGRLEELTFKYTRNEEDDEDMSFSWSTPWVGWRHIAIGGQVSHFKRGDPEDEIALLERTGLAGFLSLPLTDSRVKFSRISASLSFDKLRLGAPGEPTTKEITLGPFLSYSFDSRDSRLRPESGIVFSLGVGASYPVDGDRSTFYNARNEIRSFHRLSQKSVLALLSNVLYQFGDFPDFSVVKLGGASLRGQPDSRFTGFHRWFQTVEYRYMYLPRRIFRLPIVKEFDVGLAFVVFVDSGIVWFGSDDFELDRWHGTGGVGIRFYSPIQDVFRLDFGTNASGDSRFQFGTGIRF